MILGGLYHIRTICLMVQRQLSFPWAAFCSHSSKDTLWPGLHSDLFS